MWIWGEHDSAHKTNTSHLTDEETEAPWGEGTCLRSVNQLRLQSESQFSVLYTGTTWFLEAEWGILLVLRHLENMSFHCLHDDLGVTGSGGSRGVHGSMMQWKLLGDWNLESRGESWRRHVLRVLLKPVALSLHKWIFNKHKCLSLSIHSPNPCLQACEEDSMNRSTFQLREGGSEGGSDWFEVIQPTRPRAKTQTQVCRFKTSTVNHYRNQEWGPEL